MLMQETSYRVGTGTDFEQRASTQAGARFPHSCLGALRAGAVLHPRDSPVGRYLLKRQALGSTPG